MMMEQSGEVETGEREGAGRKGRKLNLQTMYYLHIILLPAWPGLDLNCFLKCN